MKMSILVGITLFNPEKERLIDNVSAIIGQTEKIVCVDNGSNNINEIEEWISCFGDKVDLIKNGANLGIARALNQMFEYALEYGYDAVLTLDQDSVCPSNMLEEYNKYITLEQVGCICPVIVDRNYSKVDQSAKEYDYIENCITSASLVPIRVWEAVGGFTEELFIDFVDHDFCAKLIKGGYTIIRVNSVKLLHEIGNGKDIYFLGKKTTVLNHSAFRKYYMVRNWIYYMKVHRDIINYKEQLFKYRFFFIKTFLFEDDKFNKLKNMLRGRRDGKKMCREMMRD